MDMESARGRRPGLGLLNAVLGPAPVTGQRGVIVLSWLLAATFVVMVVLFALQQSLRLDDGSGVEDWLGWRGADRLGYAWDAWSGRGLSRVPAALAYLLIDTALFMPLYGLSLLWATRLVLMSLHPQPVTLMRAPIRWTGWLAPLLVGVLWAVDAVENLGGLRRLGLSWAWWGGAGLVLALLWGWNLRTWAQAAPEQGRGRMRGPGMVAHGRGPAVIGLLILAALSVAAWSLGASAQGPASASLPLTGLFNGCAHDMKMSWFAAACAPLGLAALVRWFGVDLDPRPSQASDPLDARQRGHLREAAFRAACRQGAMAVVARSRYVLAMLVLFALFTLVMDQCRDVLLAMVSPQTEDKGVGARLWWGVVLLTSALGLGMFAHSCWLWTRLVCRVRRLSATPLPRDVAAWVGAWARTWARALMLAPLAMSALLLAYVVGDALVAATLIAPDTAHPSRAMWGLLWTLVHLALFALAVAAGGYGLMQWRRRHPLDDVADYYDSVPGVRPLLWAGEGVRSTQSVHKRWLQLHAVWLPLAALALMLVLRIAMAYMPETAGLVPPTLALLTLAAAWWLGPLGLIAMSEQRTLIPWSLLLLAIVLLCALVSDNHVLPDTVFASVAQVSAGATVLRETALMGVGWLAVGAALAWWLLVLRSSSLPVWFGRPAKATNATPSAAPRLTAHQQADRVRACLGLALYVVVCLGLWGVGRHGDRALQRRLAELETPAVTISSAEWKPRAVAGDGPVRVLAAEGGGSRAAYWTARTLAQLQRESPGWIDSVVAMSGVSGGSMGLAVWAACNRQNPADGVVACVETAFQSIDVLSPLVGGLMFEDVWMRFMPTDWLCRETARCSFRSRALAFEHEWMRAFPALGRPAREQGAPGPLLLFNSTVVESGNRGVVSTVPLPAGALAGADDLLGRLKTLSHVSLVTAAHTSARFPAVNPLASLPAAPASAASAVPIPASAASKASAEADAHDAGTARQSDRLHLADGGYNDNSGTSTLDDLLQQVRAEHGQRPVQLVLVRNGQVALRQRPVPDAVPDHGAAAKSSPAKKGCEGPSSDAKALTDPRDATRLKLYADLFGPAVAVVNVSGIGAHARAPVASLVRQLSTDPNKAWSTPIGCGSGDPVCLLDQMKDGNLVPLGWSLSLRAREAMDRRAVQVVNCALMPR